jgi:ketosteroid isomerase-like protein
MLRRLPMRVLATLSLALLISAPSCAYLHAQNGQHHDHERKHIEHSQIVALEQQWRQATLDADVPFMDRMLSDDYIGINANGEVLTKNQMLDRMRERKLVITSFETADRKIKLLGNIAIVTSLVRLNGTSDGDPLQGDFRYTRVYQRMSGGIWKVTNFEVTPSRHLEPAPTPAVAPQN